MRLLDDIAAEDEDEDRGEDRTRTRTGEDRGTVLLSSKTGGKTGGRFFYLHAFDVR